MEKDQMSVCPQGWIQVEMFQSLGLKATRNKYKCLDLREKNRPFFDIIYH